MHSDSGWTLLQCPDKFKFILVEKSNVAIEGEWNKEENGVMVQLDLPCCIFDKNESEASQTFN